jgi:Methane oxygenase PmoA
MTGFLGLGLCVLLSAADAPRAVVYEVSAGKYERRDVPLIVPLPKGWENEVGLSLLDLETNRPVSVQVVPYHVKGFYGVSWIVRAAIPAGKTRRYRLSNELSKAAAERSVHAFHDGRPERVELDEPGRVNPEPKARTLTLKVGDRPVLTYHAAITRPPAGIDPVFARGGFLHPLQTPSGAVVTDDFPPDHAHQHGVFFAWVNTTFEGRHVDFWNQKTRTGRVEPDTAAAYETDVSGGPVFGELLATLRHDDLTAPANPRIQILGKDVTPPEPKLVLREEWLILVYDLDGMFVVDFQSAQHIDHHPLLINKYHYGGFGLRGNRAWLDPTVTGDDAPDPAKSAASDFLTSDGKRRSDGNHTRPRWVDLSGRVNGKFAGVTVLDDPSNFRFPQPVRLHPNKPYFCFAPMVEDAFTLQVGKPYVSRYRLLLHDGPPDKEAIERAWRDYAEPPEVRVVDAGK